MQKTIQQLSTALIVLTLCVAPGELLAAIYKTTDKDGNIIFTDIPPQDQSGELEVSEHSSYAPPPMPSEAPAPQNTTADAPEEEEAETEVTSYTSLKIISPEDDQAVRENAGNVTISVAAEPGVDTGQGHRIEVLVDGQVAASGAASSVSLENVDRGTHVVTAQVVDADGNILIVAEPITFHMLRYSALLNRKPTPSANGS